MRHPMVTYEIPVICRREFTPVLASNECPLHRTYLSGIEESEIDFWARTSIGITRERVAWMDEQGFQFSVHSEVEDRRDPAQPDRPFHMIGMCAFRRPDFEPDWVIHYKLTFNSEVAPVAYAMRWRGAS